MTAFRLSTLIAVCALLVCNAIFPRAACCADEVRPQTLTTPEGVAFAILGEKPAKPAPTLFVFALDAERTLSSAGYRQAANHLMKRGYLCVSVDLPCHGAQRRQGEPAELQGWRHRIDQGENVMDEFTLRAGQVLDYLVSENYADPNRVAACGTSRGGFSACHFAIADPRVKCVAAYIPVADLADLREFKGAESTPLVRSLSLVEKASDLSGRGVWIAIGDRDERVNTDRSIEFARALSKSALTDSPRNIELHVFSVDGHTTPPHAPQLSARWIDEALQGE